MKSDGQCSTKRGWMCAGRSECKLNCPVPFMGVFFVLFCFLFLKDESDQIVKLYCPRIGLKRRKYVMMD